MENDKRKQININISLTDEERRMLEEISEHDDRSIARQVSFIVRKYIRENTNIEK